MTQYNINFSSHDQSESSPMPIYLSHLQSLIFLADELVLQHTENHLDNLQQAILKGTLSGQKYAEIAKKNRRSEKYVKDVACKLWKILSSILGKEIRKSNVKFILQRHYCILFIQKNSDNSTQGKRILT